MTQPYQPFPVIAVGASAGASAPIIELIRALPATIPAAVVIVQQLMQQRDSGLAALLAKATVIPVLEISDGLRLQPGHIHIFPPDRELELDQGVFRLSAGNTWDPHFSIDRFFQSLARDQKGYAIGVLLAGTGSDGVLGLGAIKSAGGITLVQASADAQQNGVPDTAVATGWVDQVLAPSDIAAQLTHLAHRAGVAAARTAHRNDDVLKKVFALLQQRSGNDFSGYKRSTVQRRIQRRMLLKHIDDLGEYVQHLEHRPDEVDALFRDLLICVTEFFRDGEAFELVRRKVLAPLALAKGQDEPIRIWVSGCATGEEVYSIAIVLAEVLGERIDSVPVQIFGTDINADAIEFARRGIFPEHIRAQVTPERLERFFTKTDNGYRVSKRLRELCIFAPQNLLKDPPFSYLDLICCRNVLIYLEKEVQARLLRIFHYALKPDGALLLGTSESTGDAADLFVAVDSKCKLYRKKYLAIRPRYALSGVTPDRAAALATAPPRAIDPQLQRALQRRLEQIILGQFTPAGAVVDEQLEVLLFLGRNAGYFDPKPGSASLNLLRLVRPELVTELRLAFNSALQNQGSCQRAQARLGEGGAARSCLIEILPLMSDGDSRYFAVIFRELSEQEPVAGCAEPDAARAVARAEGLERELTALTEYLQTVVEQCDATKEELQSANEEIQSANEELQSTNEEVETARSELQSTNKELAAVNGELESRNQELSRTVEDLNGLLLSIGFPIVILDQRLEIRRFTAPAQKLFNLIDSDIGRPFSDLRPQFELPDLRVLTCEALQARGSTSQEVHDRHSGSCYALHVHPYSEADRQTTGCVLVLVDITESRQTQQSQRLAVALRDAPDAIVAQDAHGIITAWNAAASRHYGYDEQEAVGRSAEFLLPADRRDEYQVVRRAVLAGEHVAPYASRRLRHHGELIDIELTAAFLAGDDAAPLIITIEKPAAAPREANASQETQT